MVRGSPCMYMTITPQADAADALATAITHAHSRQGIGAVASELLATRKVRQRGGRVVG